MLTLRLSRRFRHNKFPRLWHGVAWPPPISHIPRAPVARCYNPVASLDCVRFNSSMFKSSRLDEDGLPTHIDDQEARNVIERAKQVWPCPPIIPAGWSCAWENWPYLFTFFWFSPYFLMLPQIEMLVNIQYRIPGEARPILYSDERDSFVFVVNGKFYFYDCRNLEMHQFEGQWTEESLVRGMCGDFDAISKTKLEEDPEGAKVLRRIFDRDETVTQILGDKYLDYTPDVTETWEETQSIRPGQPDLTEEEAEKELDRLADEVEKKLGSDS